MPSASPPIPTSTIIALERLRARRAIRIADETRPIAGGIACRRVRGTWANVLVGAGLTQPITAADLTEAINFFAAIGKDARIEISDRADASLYEHAAAAGFSLRFMVTVLGLTIDRAQFESTPAAPPGIAITRLDPADRALCESAALVLATCFAPEGTPPRDDDFAANLAGLTHPESLGYVALANDRPIGAGMMDVDGDLATLWGAAVLPDFRRRGVQTALVQHRLHHAARAGATLITVEASAGGPTHRNAARRGFEMIATRAVVTRKHMI